MVVVSNGMGVAPYPEVIASSNRRGILDDGEEMRGGLDALGLAPSLESAEATIAPLLVGVNLSPECAVSSAISSS